MREPLTSILIPCHNSEPWVDLAISSALGQEKTNVEIIAVDDGSTDGTLRKLRQFESARVKIISTANRGASAARNTALHAAQGDFIQFLDADDLLAPTKIAKQLEQMRDDDLLLTFGSVVHFDDGSQPESGTRFDATLADSLRVPVEFLIDLLGGNGRGWMVQTGQWLLSRRMAELAGPWNESLSVDDDGEYFCRVALAAREIAPCPESLCYYRKFTSGKNLSAQHSLSRKGAVSTLASARLKSAHLAKVIQDPRLTRALAGQFSTIAVNCYPTAKDLSADATAELRKLGCGVQPPRGTRWFNIVTRLLGWKRARQMQHLAGHLRRQTLSYAPK